jgi:hypothetical protein
MENLSGDEEYGVLKNRLWAELKSVLLETEDPRILGNGDIFEGYAYVRDAPHSWAHYVAGDWKPQKY